jgi:pectate lyase
MVAGACGGGGTRGDAGTDPGADPAADADAAADPVVEPAEEPDAAPDVEIDVDEDSPYEGFGVVTQGHLSCPDAPAEVHVTSLADDGAGTLREALAEGCRLVVFDVGGTIVLESDLNIRWSHVTVDGSTAPDPGITIEQPGEIGTTIEARSSTGAAHDIIITHLRMDGQATSHVNVGDIWGLDGESAPVYNVIIDHVTGIAASDGVFDIWEDVKDVTISWCLIIDTVTALHLSTDDISRTRERISFHHNVFARNNERQIRFRHANHLLDYVNNVVYGWGWFEDGGYGLHVHLDPGEVNTSMNVIANVFHFVDGLHGGDEDAAIEFERGADEGTVYFEANVVPTGEADDVSSGAMLDIPGYARVTTYDATDLDSEVVPHVGTHFPTTGEQALLAEIAAAIAP